MSTAPEGVGLADRADRQESSHAGSASGPCEAYAAPLISHVSRIDRDSAVLVRENGVVTEHREPARDLPHPDALGQEPAGSTTRTRRRCGTPIERFRRATEHASACCDEQSRPTRRLAARARWFPRLADRIAEATQAHDERVTPSRPSPAVASTARPRPGGRGAGPRPEAPRRAHPSPRQRAARRIDPGVDDRDGASRRGGRPQPGVAPRRQRGPAAARRLARRRIGGTVGRAAAAAGGCPPVRRPATPPACRAPEPPPRGGGRR